MVTIKNLTKDYEAFHLCISMELREGCITGLVGKNGAGKSTTIKAILGLVRPDAGSVTVFGKDAFRLTPADKEQIGAALSETGFSPYLTVGDAARILSRLYRRFDKTAFLESCRSHGLPETQLVKTFSTGMQAKLRVLVALSHHARLLILDEPTAGLDVEARNEILDILRQYLTVNKGSSILITSHIATDLEGLCDDIYLIHQGKMVLHEDTDVILSDYAILKVEEEDYQALERDFLLRTRREPFGYRCLTSQKQFFIENHPGLVIEKSGIDDLILMMTGGEPL